MQLLPAGYLSNWKVVLFVICNYGFWKEIRPITPFILPYLVDGDSKNLTVEAVYSEVFPWWTYSYLVFLVPVFILTDLVGYRKIIVAEAAAYIVTWILIIWGRTIPMMQLMQVSYGLATATEVGYYAYIYGAISPDHYQRATSYVRGAVLLGRFVAYALGQALISSGAADYMDLNYVTFTCMIGILFIAIVLPSVQYERSGAGVVENVEHPEPRRAGPALDSPLIKNKSHEKPIASRTKPSNTEYLKDLLRKFIRNYRKGFVLKWSIWWGLATCGYFQVGNYVQSLWDIWQHDPETSSGSVWNGLTEAINTLLGAVVAVSVQYLKLNWTVVGEGALGLLTLIQGLLLLFISQTDSIVVAYVFYVLFSLLYQMLITIATFNVASKLEEGSYGLVIGCNTFIALLLQTILTLAVADGSGFNLTIRNQFLVYGAYHCGIAVIFLLMGILVLCHYGIRGCWSLMISVPSSSDNKDGKEGADPRPQSNEPADDDARPNDDHTC